MSPQRSSNRAQRPTQRRPRTEKACSFCKKAKHRCEPNKYGTNDRPCRRCVLHRLDCDLSRPSRSQSPSSGSSVQGTASVQHHIAPPSADGPNEEPMQGPEVNVQYTPQPDPVPIPMGGWPTFMVASEEQRGPSTTTFVSGHVAPEVFDFTPLASAMEDCYQSYSSAAQGSADLELPYYPQDYYGHATSSNVRMMGYVTQSANDGEPSIGYVVEEPQISDDGGSPGEQDVGFFHHGGS